jgi:hypothetical protein
MWLAIKKPRIGSLSWLANWVSEISFALILFEVVLFRRMKHFSFQCVLALESPTLEKCMC